MLTNPWLGLALLAALLLLMLGALRSARAHVTAEQSRKLAHVGLGLTTLSFPVLFHDVWPVAVLVALTIGVLASIRWVPPLRAHFGGVVDGVERRSGGALYFPIAAGLLFVVARGDPVMFGIPILTLTFADAAAAIVGAHYGRTRIQRGAEAKTVEGSFAFFATAFITTFVPLRLLTTVGALESLLIGITFGVLVMMLEAVSLRGVDNLFIPFGGYLLLDAFLKKSALELGTALAVITLFLALTVGLRTRRTLSNEAVLAAVLVGFVSWAAGGWKWVVPPLVLFLTYTAVWPRRRLVRERPHELMAVAAVASPGLLWLLLAFVLDMPALYYPYTLAFAAHMCFIGITWYRLARPNQHALTSVMGSSVVAWLALFAPYAISERANGAASMAVAAALVWLVVGGIAFTYAVPYRRDASTRWLTQALLGLGTSALGLMLVGFR